MNYVPLTEAWPNIPLLTLLGFVLGFFFFSCFLFFLKIIDMVIHLQRTENLHLAPALLVNCFLLAGAGAAALAAADQTAIFMPIHDHKHKRTFLNVTTMLLSQNNKWKAQWLIFELEESESPPPNHQRKAPERAWVFVQIWGEGSTDKKSFPVYYLPIKLYGFTSCRQEPWILIDLRREAAKAGQRCRPSTCQENLP